MKGVSLRAQLHSGQYMTLWLALSGICGSVQATEKLLFGYSYHGPPFHIGSDLQLKGGILKDVALAIAEAVEASPEFVNVPVKRADDLLTSGKVDLLCLYNPHWLAYPERYVWSTPVADYSEYYIAHRENSFHTYSDLSGKVIGTNLGYNYSPTTMRMFHEGTMQRLEMSEMERMYNLLSKRRIDALIDTDLSFYYLQKQGKIDHRLTLSDVADATYGLSCAISHESPIAPVALQESIQHLKNQNVFQRILNTYR